MDGPQRPETTGRLLPPTPSRVREWLPILVAIAIALPSPVIRILETAGAVHLGLEPLVESLIFGVGILAAATLLTWAAEVAETEISAGLALAGLALIAVLPEYAVDLFFAIEAPHVPMCNPDLLPDLVPTDCQDPHPQQLAIANMTGANRLLVGMAWPAIFLIHFLKTRKKTMTVQKGNALGILFLGAATIYSFSIPLRGHLSLLDTGVMFSLFAVYLYFTSRQPPEKDRVLIGPAAAVGALSKLPRRLTIIAIFVYAAGVIFASAEPFAEGLVDTGENIGVNSFILVQWVAPLASEAPEFILAGLLAMRGRHHAAMTILISSKVNQWTLLLGSLPVAFSISGGSLEPMDFDTRQQEEVFLTAGQSLFAVAILLSLSMSRWEAIVLGALFVTQFAFTDGTIRMGYGILYTGLALVILLRDIPSMPTFFGAAKDAAFDPEKLAAESEHPPPDDGDT
ncbi:MAG: hypothetical protein IH957_07395 [Chloroflexi bacterium]|nr:hypothetical protein [Chloroflexota bacterium]